MHHGTVSHENLEEMRTAVQVKAAHSSVRCVAQEIKVGHTTLYNFMRGAKPHSRILVLLVKWYEGDDFRISLALDALLGNIPAVARPRADRALLAAAAEEYRSASVALPSWLNKLLSQTDRSKASAEPS